MNIQPLEKNIKSLIGDQSSYFTIPDYQRPFRWGEEKIDDFWNDIITAYDNNEENYFLGSLILIRSNDYEVVDGQQRLTTITIFLAVMRDYFAQNGKIELAEKIQNEFICKDGKYRLQVRPEDKLNFINSILKGVSSLNGINNSSLGENFVNAVEYLQNNIQTKGEELLSEGKDLSKYLEDLYNYFMDKTLVVSMIAEDLSSAYTIFETINNRGEQLETDELLKNFLLKRLQEEVARHNKQNPQSEKNFDAEKQALLSGYKYIRGIAGENIEMQELLRHHWTAIMGIKPKNNLYKEIINYIKGRNISSEDFIREWKQSSDYYASLLGGSKYEELSSIAKNNLKLLWGLNHSEWLPVLIAARRNNFSNIDFEELIYQSERAYTLFFIAGYTTVKIKNPTMALIRDYINKNKSIEEIKEYFANIIRKAMVLTRFNDSINSDCYGQYWCRYVLAKYEYCLTDSSVTKKIDFNSTQIEHILPQTMSAKAWKDNFTKEEHENLVNTIGNLTLLSGGVKNKSKNQAASNKSFKEKIEVYSGIKLGDGLCAFQMTQNLSHYNDWTPSTIRKRAKKIIDKLKEEWKISDEDIKNEKNVDTGEEGLISNKEIEDIKKIVDLLEAETGVKLEKVPDVIDDKDIIHSKRKIRESCIDLVLNDSPIWFGFWRGEVGEMSFCTYLYIQWDDRYEEYLKQLFDDQFAGKILSGWIFDDTDAHFFFRKVNFDNKEDVVRQLKEAQIIVEKYNNELKEIEIEDQDDDFDYEEKKKGNYPDDILKMKLTEALKRDTPLTPRLINFLELLLSKQKTFSREKIKEELFRRGVGDDVGQAGRYLSNISQFITKDDNDFLRQVIDFEAGNWAGAKKDNYIIIDKYRELLKDVLLKFKAKKQQNNPYALK
jgi:uncharacterized protein with ParB-like and HNH nuclease domain